MLCLLFCISIHPILVLMIFITVIQILRWISYIKSSNIIQDHVWKWNNSSSNQNTYLQFIVERKIAFGNTTTHGLSKKPGVCLIFFTKGSSINDVTKLVVGWVGWGSVLWWCWVGGVGYGHYSVIVNSDYSCHTWLCELKTVLINQSHQKV